MAGLFKIHPENGSTITCSLTNDDNETYIVPNYDFKEAEREKVLYSEGLSGGKVNGIDYGDVEADIQFIIAGDTWEEIAAAQRVLSQAFRDPDGGYIEFRPAEFSSSVMSTWYHYLQSGPPTAGGKNSKPVVSGYKLAEFYEYKVTIKAWATSDPNTYETIVSSTAITYGARGSNYITVSDSSIKGDGVIPIIELDLDGNVIGKLLIYQKRLIPGNPIAQDFFETNAAELNLGAVGGSWTVNVVDATATNNGYSRLDADSGHVQLHAAASTLSDVNSDYFGKILIVAGMWIEGSGEWTARPYTTGAGTTEYANTISLTGTIKDAMHEASEMNYPPFNILEELSSSSTPTLAEWVLDNSGSNIGFSLTKISGTTQLSLDFIWLVNTSNGWITSIEHPTGGNAVSGLSYLVIDSIKNTIYEEYRYLTTRNLRKVWKKVGMPYSDFVLNKGFDHRIRLLGLNTSGYDADDTGNVTLKGVYITIYPFDEP